MFHHIDIPVHKIEQINGRPEGRVYKTPENNFYPSITTLLGSLSDNSFLQEWYDRVGEETAKKITEDSKNRGNNLHKVCEDYLNNLDIDLSNIDTKSNFLQINPYVDKIQNIRGVEIPLYSNRIKIAGTSDCIAEYDGDLAIIDFKTSRKVKRVEWIEGYFIQASFYAIAFSELYNVPIPKKLVIIMATDENCPCIFVEDTVKYGKLLINKQKEYYETLH